MQLLLSDVRQRKIDILGMQFMLMDYFGHASNPKHMKMDLILTSGEYGIWRFYNLVVAPVLDDFDTENKDYKEFLNVFKVACSAIARKIRNYFRVCTYSPCVVWC